MATLELLPMWGGAEPNVQLFASGIVLEDGGEWAGGQKLKEAAGVTHLPFMTTGTIRAFSSTTQIEDSAVASKIAS